MRSKRREIYDAIIANSVDGISHSSLSCKLHRHGDEISYDNIRIIRKEKAS